MRHNHVQSVLPRLRRYAFVLAGDREKADELVLKCLQSFKADPATVRTGNARLDLFRLFHAVSRAPMLRVVAGRETNGAQMTAHPTAGRANALTADQRCVVALMALEGFDKAQCAEILDLPEERVGELARQARRSVAAAPQRQLAVCS